MALVGFAAQQCVPRPWSTSWRLSGWDDLGTYTQFGALYLTVDETGAVVGGCTQATIVADGSPFAINGGAVPGFVAVAGVANAVTVTRIGDTIHATANGSTLARALGLVGVSGAGSVTLGAVTSASGGTVVAPRVGTSSVALAAVSAAASGIVGSAPRVGTASAVLGAVGAAGTGTVASASNPMAPITTFLKDVASPADTGASTTGNASIGYTTTSASGGTINLYQIQSDAQSASAFAVGTNRFVVRRTQAAASLSGVGKSSCLIHKFKTSVDATEYAVGLSTGGDLTMLIGFAAGVVAANAVADSGQTGVVVRGADWASRPVFANAAAIPLQYSMSLQAAAGAISLGWWSGTAWLEIMKYRPVGGVGSGFVPGIYVQAVYVDDNSVVQSLMMGLS